MCGSIVSIGIEFFFCKDNEGNFTETFVISAVKKVLTSFYLNKVYAKNSGCAKSSVQALDQLWLNAFLEPQTMIV